MNNRDDSFKRNLRQFRILTIVGYLLTWFIIVGMVIAGKTIPQTTMSVPAELPIALVGLVLLLSVAFPFLWAAYDKTICPHCGKRIEDGYFYWHGIKCNGPTRRYWKLFFGKPLQCPHCHKDVCDYGRHCSRDLLRKLGFASADMRTSDPTMHVA